MHTRWNQKWSALRTAEEPVTHEAFFSKLIWKSKQSVPDTFSLLMLFKRQCEKNTGIWEQQYEVFYVNL